MAERKSLLALVEQTVFHTNNAYTRALYRCECGNLKEINMRKVRELRTLSCGCLTYTCANRKGHKLSKHPLYKILKGIHARCYNKNNEAYSRYGGAGVTICDEWLNDRGAFVKWGLSNGWKRGLEIDKDIIPKRLGIPANIYSPQTCMFVTRKENCNARKSNVMLTYKGRTQNMVEWCAELNLPYSVISLRIRNLKWSAEKALSTPTYKGLIIEYKGISRNLSEWSRQTGIKIGTLSFRLLKGWSIEKALTTPVGKINNKE